MGGLSLLAAVLWIHRSDWRKKVDLRLAVQARTEQLGESERKLRVAMRLAHLSYWEDDFVSNRFSFSEEGNSILGIPLDEHSMTWDEFIEFVHPDDRSIIIENRTREMRGELHHQIANRVVRADGEVRYLEALGETVLSETGRPIRSVGAIQDITERKRAEEALRVSEERYRSVLTTTADGFSLTDMQGKIIEVNEAYCRMVGYERAELLTMSIADIDALEDFEHFLERTHAIIDKGSSRFQSKHRRKDSSVIDVEVSVTVMQDGKTFVSFYHDITDKKQLEEQFIQAQKMEAIGQLAGGVAHDFNNLLTIISGYSEYLLLLLPQTDPNREIISEISEAGERAAGLTRQLLAFSRKSVIEPKVLDLNDLVRENEKMLRRLIGEDILLITVLDPTLEPVKVDPGQVGQVIMNLAVNARDAMPTGGKLTIKTSLVSLDDTAPAFNSEAKPGRYVLLAVSDTGIGMTPDVQSRIFEPFFSTKRLGKGTGLGLAMVNAIVKQSDGFICVYSEPECGTSFNLYFPVSAEKTSKPPKGAKPMSQGTETILVVEDENTVRNLIRNVLQQSGYMVLETDRGSEALRLAVDHVGPIHLLITDVVMPEMSGRELVERLTRLRSETKVLYLSGYTDDTVVRHGVLQAEVAFLQKTVRVGGTDYKGTECAGRFLAVALLIMFLDSCRISAESFAKVDDKRMM